jgi:hypothetical protein
MTFLEHFLNENVSRLIACLGFGVSTVVKASRAALLATCFLAGFLLGLFFDPEDVGNMLLQNVY